MNIAKRWDCWIDSEELVMINIVHNHTRFSDWPYRRSTVSQEFVDRNCATCIFASAEVRTDFSKDWDEFIPQGWKKNLVIFGCNYTIPINQVNGVPKYQFCYPLNVIPPRKKLQTAEHARRMRQAALAIEKASFTKNPQRGYREVQEQFKRGEI